MLSYCSNAKIFFQSFFMLMTIQPSFCASSQRAWGKAPTLVLYALNVADRITLVEANGEAAPAALDGRRYGGVLSHGVLMYLDDPEPMLDALVALAAPTGVVSIVAKNVEVMAGPAAAATAVVAKFFKDKKVNDTLVDVSKLYDPSFLK